MEKSNRYTFIFVTVISLIAALILSLASQLLKDRQRINIETDMKKNILASVGLMDGGICMTPEGRAAGECTTVQCCYEKNIRSLIVDFKGSTAGGSLRAEDISVTDELNKPVKDRRYPVFIRMEGNSVKAYCIPLIGKGLWSTLLGYMALKPDLNTVTGITFYKHGETPGLGAEIETDWFLNSFRNKKILNSRGELVAVTVVKGKANPASPDFVHQVDGISGATLTCNGVNDLIKKNLSAYEPYFSRIRRSKEK